MVLARMSACNGEVTCLTKTFFGDVDSQFPIVNEDQKIDTKQFLNASRLIVRLFDRLGTAFTPVKYDVNGNIEKLDKKFNTDPERFRWLNDMLLSELEDNAPQVAVCALLWLKRALEFTRVLLKCIIEDADNGKKTENLTPFCRRAYEETLKKYHAWMVQSIVALCMRAVPWRRDLIRTLALGQDNLDDLVISDMREFVQCMDTNLDIIVEFYKFHNLDSDEKV